MMSLSMKRTVGAVATAPSFSRTPRMAVLTRAKEQPTIDPVGYINNDNSGKGNMFPTSELALKAGFTSLPCVHPPTSPSHHHSCKTFCVLAEHIRTRLLGPRWPSR